MITFISSLVLLWLVSVATVGQTALPPNAQKVGEATELWHTLRWNGLSFDYVK